MQMSVWFTFRPEIFFWFLPNPTAIYFIYIFFLYIWKSINLSSKTVCQPHHSHECRVQTNHAIMQRNLTMYCKISIFKLITFYFVVLLISSSRKWEWLIKNTIHNFSAFDVSNSNPQLFIFSNVFPSDTWTCWKGNGSQRTILDHLAWNPAEGNIYTSFALSPITFHSNGF